MIENYSIVPAAEEMEDLVMRGTYQPNVQDIRFTDGPATQRRRAEVGVGVIGAVRTALAAVARWRDRRAALADLNALPDWALSDIGIDRADIPQVAEAIADKLRETGRGSHGELPKLHLVHEERPNGEVRVVRAGSPQLAGCG